MPWIHEAEPAHECQRPAIHGMSIKDLTLGDVWLCEECLALWMISKDQYGRFTWRRGGFWLAWKHRKAVDKFRRGRPLPPPPPLPRTGQGRPK